jgi:hypothetical protein
MIVAMQESATDEQIQQVVEHLLRMAFPFTALRASARPRWPRGARVDFDTRNLRFFPGGACSPHQCALQIGGA